MIEYSDEEARRDPSPENMSDLTVDGWCPRVISHTPVIASKIWTLSSIPLAIVLPFGENATQSAHPGTCIVRIHASHEDPTPPMTRTSVANSDLYCCRWDFVGTDGKAE
jgi:hypothetical protein